MLIQSYRQFSYRVFTAWLGLMLLPISGLAQSSELLFLLDADRSQIVLFDPASGTSTEPYTIPVVCQPEGACGLAYDGHSLFFVDATDLSQRIYELNPVDGRVWNSFPAPAAGIDGLAFDNGILYAVSFDEDTIYQVDTFNGQVLGSATVDADLIGGLGAGGGRLFATDALNAEVLEIDPSSGAVVQRFPTESTFPTGLAVVNGKLFVTEFGLSRLLQINPDSGENEAEFAQNLEFLAALASGPPLQPPSYDMQLELVEEIPLDTEVEFVFRASLFDETGRLFETNDASRVSFAIVSGTGDIDGGSRQRVSGGQVDVVIRVPLGGTVRLEASLSGLPTRSITLGAVALAGRLNLSLTRDPEDDRLLAVDAEVFDVFGELVQEDTSRVRFEVVSGRGVVVGASAVVPSGGQASTVVQLFGTEDDLEVVARIRDVERRAVLAGETAGSGLAAPAGGLTVSETAVAGRDERPPEPPSPLLAAANEQGQVELQWQRSSEDGLFVSFSFGGLNARLPLIAGYLLFRNKDDGLFEQIGQVDTEVDRFEDALGAEPEPGVYRYKVVVDDGTHLREALVLPGTEQDLGRSVVIGRGVAVDENGEVVRGLFSPDDLTVDFNDFFLFAENFGRSTGEAEFDELFDLDGDGDVGFSDFFLFAENFGRSAVELNR
jgi:hypothetical protein